MLERGVSRQQEVPKGIDLDENKSQRRGKRGDVICVSTDRFFFFNESFSLVQIRLFPRGVLRV